jgi:bifunctional non-homologous end joining protein LigD
MLSEKLIGKTAIQFSESSEIDGPRCTGTPVRSGLRAWSRRCATAAIRPGAAITGVNKTCQQREMLPIAAFALKEIKFDGIYGAAGTP